MTLTTALHTATRLAGALLMLAALIAGSGARHASADSPALCPDGRPCITELYLSGTALFARWTGDWDAYNIRWENPGLVLAHDVGGAKTHTLRNLERGRTYRLSVQGCKRKFLAPSECSPWSARELTIDALRAPRLESATALSDTTIRLVWRDTNTTSVQGFRLVYFPRGEAGTRAQQVLNLPAARDSAGKATYDAAGLTAGRTYCFQVEAEASALHDDRIVADFSGPSNELCETAESPFARSLPSSRLDTVAAGTSSRASSGILQRPGTIDAVVAKPDLVAVRVSGNAQVFDGQNAVYEVVVRNDKHLGPAPQPIELVIVFGGALEAGGFVDATNGFSCTGQGALTCTGALGGESAHPLDRVANIRVRAHATTTGAGSITMTVDPQNAVAETDEANNTQALAIVVK